MLEESQHFCLQNSRFSLTLRAAAPYNRAVVRALVLVASGLMLTTSAAGADPRAVIEAYFSRLQNVQLTDLTIEQTFTLYHPDGLHPRSTGEQRVFVKVPRRQRIEQTIEGQREVRVAVGDRVWIRQRDGKTYEAPPSDREGERTYLLVPFQRTADDLLAEWRTFGVRDSVSHTIRIRGRAVTVLGAAPGERDVPAVWLDAEYGVVRFVARERLATGEALVDLAFSEHRPILGGFFFPHRQEIFVGGKLVMLVIVRGVAANTNLSDTLFDPDALRQGR